MNEINNLYLSKDMRRFKEKRRPNIELAVLIGCILAFLIIGIKYDSLSSERHFTPLKYEETPSIDGVKQELVNYAWKKYDNMDMLLTFTAENVKWNHKTVRSAELNGNGFADHGICQLNEKYHEKFINSKQFNNPYKQLDYCIKLYKNNKYQFLAYAKKNNYKYLIK